MSCGISLSTLSLRCTSGGQDNFSNGSISSSFCFIAKDKRKCAASPIVVVKGAGCMNTMGDVIQCDKKDGIISI